MHTPIVSIFYETVFLDIWKVKYNRLALPIPTGYSLRFPFAEQAQGSHLPQENNLLERKHGNFLIWSMFLKYPNKKLLPFYFFLLSPMHSLRSKVVRISDRILHMTPVHRHLPYCHILPPVFYYRFQGYQKNILSRQSKFLQPGQLQPTLRLFAFW